ncbi:hypothetical protein G4B88_024829 [Cannabis sativa]|uniref:Uncharacterized protein n=1 Tax=Cannabis sativa TaxID=3483 RepID=A0A7J6DQ45_CANSA|nr:hypothetical protein G4B88_024829 [Cannabis sativa]
MQILGLFLLSPLSFVVRLFSRFDDILGRRKEHATPLTSTNHDSHKDSPVAVENREVEKNTSWVNPEPKFPPAPVNPDMIPKDLRETKGMMPNVAPQAA